MRGAAEALLLPSAIAQAEWATAPGTRCPAFRLIARRAPYTHPPPQPVTSIAVSYINLLHSESNSVVMVHSQPFSRGQPSAGPRWLGPARGEHVVVVEKGCRGAWLAACRGLGHPFLHYLVVGGCLAVR